MSSYTPTPAAQSLAGGTEGGASAPDLSRPQSTSYRYNALGLVERITQGQQVRSFEYDSLGRTISVTTPEAGTVDFEYTTFGALAKRTDARLVETTYSYDALHRLSQVDYDVTGATNGDATPSVGYTYGTDPLQLDNGRLVTMVDADGSVDYTYDSMGRTLSVLRTFAGQSGSTLTSYGYNDAGLVSQLIYPCSKTVDYVDNDLGRVRQVSVDGLSYVDDITYSPAGMREELRYGNGVVGQFTYTERLQSKEIEYDFMVDPSDETSWYTLMRLSYGYGSPSDGRVASIEHWYDPDGDGTAGDTQDVDRSLSYSFDVWGAAGARNRRSRPGAELEAFLELRSLREPAQPERPRGKRRTIVDPVRQLRHQSGGHLFLRFGRRSNRRCPRELHLRWRITDDVHRR